MATSANLRSARRNEARIVTLLIGLITLFLLWQALTYRGFMAFFAEWQFDALGQYYPTLTFLSVLAILGLPLFIVSRIRSRRVRRAARRSGTEMRSAAGAERFATVLIALAAASAVGTLVSLLLTFSLPSASGTPRLITVGGIEATSPAEGPTVLRGSIAYDRTTALNEALWLVRREVRFAPVIGPGGIRRGGELRYFVELTPDSARPAGRSDVRLSGILHRNGLPGELVRLYRYAGYRVEPPHYVLFASKQSLLWPYFVAAGEFALAGITLLIFALIQKRYARRLSARIAGSTETS